MKKRLLFFSVFMISFFAFTNVSASGSLKISLSCPGAAKPNSEIVCKVYGISSESEVDSIEEINAVPSGSLRSASYYGDYGSIPVGSQKNVGMVTIKTGSVGTGYVKVVFDAIHFVDESFQESVSVRKKIIVNETGSIVNENTNSSNNSNNQNSNNNNSNNSNNSNISNDTHLKNIKLSRGILSPAFSKNVYNYNVKVDSDVDKITIDAIKNDVNQVIEGEVIGAKLKYGKNEFKLVVTNGTGIKREYQIIINREDNRDTNATLAALSLSSGSIHFSPDVYEYSTKVLYEVTNISVLANPEKTTSTVKVEGDKDLIVGENTIIITVKSEKGNEKKYTIKVNRLAEGEQIGDNANIKNIIVAGYDLAFDYDKQEYKLLIKKEDKLNITVDMDDPNASYIVTGNDNLSDGSKINIVTQSVDGSATKTYTIEITKLKYTTYYVGASILVVLTVTIPILFYVKYVKPKKQLVDINGNKIGKDDLFNREYRTKLTTDIPKQVPNKVGNEVISNDQRINQSVSNMQSGQTQYAINISDYSQNNVNSTQAVKCPKCGRDLLGDPSICPYCNNILK